MEKDNNIEQFFKKHLEVENDSFMEGDWALMEKKLDVAGMIDSTGSSGISSTKVVLMLLLFGSITFLIGWYFGLQSDSKEATELNHSQTEISETLPNNAIIEEGLSSLNEDEQIEITQSDTENQQANALSSSSNKVLDNNSAESNSLIDDTQAFTSNNKDQAKPVLTTEDTHNVINKDIKDDQTTQTDITQSNTEKQQIDEPTSLSEKVLETSTTETNEHKNDDPESIRYNSIDQVKNESSKEGSNNSKYAGSIDPNNNRTPIYLEDSNIPDSEPGLIPPKSYKTNLISYGGRINMMTFDSADSTDQVEDSKQAMESKASFNRFYLGFSFAPDLNSAGWGEPSSLSGRVGARLSFNIFEKWSIASGIFYNTKKYGVAGEAYSPPPGYWQNGTGGAVPDWVDASCSVIDIPVTLTFQQSLNEKINLVLTGGVSHYTLLDEEYIFDFGRNNPYRTDEWSTDENTVEGFTTINASVGVEFILKEQRKIRLEGYVKSPFKTIGWGNVKLYSNGLMISYMIPLKKRSITNVSNN